MMNGVLNPYLGVLSTPKYIKMNGVPNPHLVVSSTHKYKDECSPEPEPVSRS